MKRQGRLIGPLLVAIALLAAACGGSDDGDAGGSGGDSGGGDLADFKIAIVAPSAANDLAFTQSIVNAVEALGVAEPAISEGMFNVPDAEAAIRGYAEEDFDLVIAHGTQYGGGLETIAAEFPEVAFAWGTNTNTFGLPNVSAYTVRSDEGGYVLGVLAAGMVGDGNIGIVGPIAAGDAKLYIDGFTAGVNATDPGVKVTTNYIESFSDVALATEAGQTFADNGATVMTGTAQMTVGPIGVAKEAGITWFGTQSNQTQLAPDVIAANQVYHWEVVLEDIVDGIRNGDLGGEAHTLTLENGGLVIEYNDAVSIPADSREAADKAATAISEGSLSTGVS